MAFSLRYVNVIKFIYKIKKRRKMLKFNYKKNKIYECNKRMQSNTYTYPN